MLVFFKKIFLFLLPVSLIFVFPAMIAFFGREYVSPHSVVQAQINFPEVLSGTAYNSESFIPYKRLLVDAKKPTVVALGTSRVMQIRKEFFKDSEAFVNAGGAAKTLGDIDLFIRELPPDDNVKVLILSLDQNMFYKDTFSHEDRGELILPVKLMKLGSMSRKIYLDYATHKFSLTELIDKHDNSKNIGLIALTQGDGFRSDGSYRYNQASLNLNRNDSVSIEIQQKIDGVKKNSREASVYQKQQLDANLKLLSDILDLCEQKNITVLGFMPPFPEPVYQAMLDTSGLDNEMVTIMPKEVANVFIEHNSFFYDLSSPTVFGGKKTEFVDVVHGTDLMYLKIMVYISEHTDILDEYVDSEFLKETVKNTKQDFLQF
jgi:hypothetical protein